MYIHAWHDLTVYDDLLRSCLKCLINVWSYTMLYCLTFPLSSKRKFQFINSGHVL